ncbi:hypothetical protein AK812_SmicGene38379 [Symbiodinium microadriaticum]|uniref:AB hydrolase-1 domain-containing protein n=1 Tax=Symbiodinium microadriaticum TaxID=2951 RepID=A0A1Q9CDW5_SYMMI|nr:hypothetical protein AK812_SmicGene38379 [Symbiodinium microadriaticum]
MGNGTSTSAGDKVPLSSMRCRSESQVPRCFRNVKCPYTPASTADGAYGVVNYSLIGPKDGQVVVCFHGLNGSRLLFQDTALYLSRYGGFRVLTFDLYGHGLSNAPPVDLCPGRSCSSACKPGCFSCSGTRARKQRHHFNTYVGELMLHRAGGYLKNIDWCIRWDHDWDSDAHPGVIRRQDLHAMADMEFPVQVEAGGGDVNVLDRIYLDPGRCFG